MNSIQWRINEMNRRVDGVKQAGLYFYNQPIDALDGAWVIVGERRMLMFASYSYLGLMQHPRIDAAAQEAIARFGSGTHGVRILAALFPCITSWSRLSLASRELRQPSSFQVVTSPTWRQSPRW